MKAITIKQPWASLIVAGIKDIENRTWKTSFRGRVLIHAAKTPVKEGLMALNNLQLFALMRGQPRASRGKGNRTTHKRAYLFRLVCSRCLI